MLLTRTFVKNKAKKGLTESVKENFMTKGDFKRIIRAGNGHLADKAKLEEYAKLMVNKKPRQPKSTGSPETKAN